MNPTGSESSPAPPPAREAARERVRLVLEQAAGASGLFVMYQLHRWHLTGPAPVWLLLLSVVVGPDMRDRHSLPAADFDWLGVLKEEFKGKKIAYSPDFGYEAVDNETKELTRKAGFEPACYPCAPVPHPWLILLHDRRPRHVREPLE